VTRTERIHRLKTWPEPFQAVFDGRKRYEIRRDDRGFMVGDILDLAEWDPASFTSLLPVGFTGRSVRVRVAYLTPGGAWGLPANMCVMSIVRDGEPDCEPLRVEVRRLNQLLVDQQAVAERIERRLAHVEAARNEACEMLLKADLTVSEYEIAHQLLEVGSVPGIGKGVPS